jgi:hypothetical protein
MVNSDLIPCHSSGGLSTASCYGFVRSIHDGPNEICGG